MRRSLFLAVVSSLSASLLPAATLSGVVTSPNGQPLPQVVLRLQGASTVTVVSGEGGRYRVADLAAGTYRIESAIRGFTVAAPAEVRIADEDARLDVTLAAAPVREYVAVAATRGDAPASTVGVATTVLDEQRLADRQATSLVQLLQDVPGVAINRTGPTGRQTTLFLRGGGSTATRVIVDGVPVNEPGGYFDYGNLLAVGVQQVEIVRGAASSLYGSDALAGVIEMHTRRPLPGDPVEASLGVDAGSSSFERYQGAFSGQRGAFDWNAALQHLNTENEGVNAGFDENAGSLSLGARLGERWSLQLVGRGADSHTGTPGQTVFGQQDDSYFDRTDALASLRLSGLTGLGGHEVRLGFASAKQLSVDPTDSGPYLPTYGDKVSSNGEAFDYPNSLGYQNNTARQTAGYKLERQMGARHLVTGGVDLEHESGDLGDRGQPQPMLSPTRTNVGGYVQDRWTVTEALFLTAGARLEHNDSFGTAAVPRAALSWRISEQPGGALRMMASAGAGIKEPGFFESFGTSDYAMGNPDLEPERSRTYDLGLEERAFSDRARLGVTAYRHDYLDQIAYTSDPVTYLGTWTNLGETRAQGFEVELEAQPFTGWRVLGQYTYTDSTIVVSNNAFDDMLAVGKPLLRRPEHMGSFTAQYQTRNGRLAAAGTLVLVGERADSDFSGLGLEKNEGYARLDARVRARVHRHLDVFAIAENLNDSDHQEVLGYPTLGRSLRIGLTARTGN